jgi:transposase
VRGARRFRCVTVMCGRRIFTERFDDGAPAPWARRTARLDLVVHHLGLALGGRPAVSFARRLMLPVSNDTLLQMVRRRGCPPFVAPSVIGIDDWAWRRNQRYGTIICDLERRRPITLFPDRASHRAGQARGATPDRCGRARLRRRLRPCCSYGAPARRPGRRPLGTSWRMPATPSSMRYANPCARSASRSAPPP